MSAGSKTPVWIRDMPWVLLDYMTAQTIGRTVKVYREQDCGQARELEVYCAKPMGPALGQDPEVWAPTRIWDHFGELMLKHRPSIDYASSGLVKASSGPYIRYDHDVRLAVCKAVIFAAHGHSRPTVNDDVLKIIDPNKQWRQDRKGSALR